MDVKNAKGKIFYGMHFYPGVAEYAEDHARDPYRVFLNEDTIRSMDPSFAGRPVFVMHVDEVEQDIDLLRREADGWVSESFYNAADGKHWVKFIVVSDKAEEAIRRGMRLSNCYIPKSFGPGGLWNGVSYAKEITGGEYEHLAIVPNPRYEESVIMTPEAFKKYNDDKMVELKRLANDKTKKEGLSMKFKFFKKAKVENAIDLEEMSVVLPKTGKEMTLVAIINEMDSMEEKKDMNAGMADGGHKVKMFDGSHCTVNELVEKHKALHDELESMKMKKEDSEDQDKEYSEKEENAEGKDMPHGDSESDVAGGESKKNEEDDEKAKKKALELAEHEDKEIKEAKAKNAKEKADRLRNAPLKAAVQEFTTIELSDDKVVRGRSRYGS